MPLNQGGRNAGVNGLATAIGFLRLHSAFPGTSGANEISGGSPTAYTGKAVTWGSASDGVRTQTGGATFDIPPSTTVKYVSGADAATAGNFYAVWPLGGADKEMQVDVTNNLILSEGHGFAAGDRVVFLGLGGTMPPPLVEGTEYFVLAAGLTADKFAISATSGGTAITLTGKGDTRAVVSKIVPEIFGAQQQATISGLVLQVGG
jgi:hypothetical protein